MELLTGGPERVVVPSALEEIGDPLPVLREYWHRLDGGGTVVVRFGAGKRGMSARDVANLLILAGFAPTPPRPTTNELEIDASWQPRTVQTLSCSVIVPCRNEVENVATLVQRLPRLGSHTQLIFVDGSSTDGTPAAIQQLIDAHPDRDIVLLHQRGDGGKAEAVFTGFDAAIGDVLMILDADMTVAPEDLPRFHDALAEGVASFANGTRFLYPMESGAMRLSNNLGNRAFSVILSWLVGARVSDTLCGTKALFRRDWKTVSAARPLFGRYDRWGDFDLLLGAAYAGLRIVDVPVRYGARTAGESKMRPVHDGLELGRTCLAGARHLKLTRRKVPTRTS